MKEIKELYRIFTDDALHSPLFKEDGDSFVLERNLSSSFTLRLFVRKDKRVFSEVYDEDGETFLPYSIAGYSGTLLSRIQEEIDQIVSSLRNIHSNSSLEKEILAYVREKYSTNAESLFGDDTLVLRRNDTRKWYGIIMSVRKSKITGDSQSIVRIVNMRVKREDVKDLVDMSRIFPAWHMCKRTWCTVILDGSLSQKEILSMLDTSYTLAL